MKHKMPRTNLGSHGETGYGLWANMSIITMFHNYFVDYRLTMKFTLFPPRLFLLEPHQPQECLPQCHPIGRSHREIPAAVLHALETTLHAFFHFADPFYLVLASSPSSSILPPLFASGCPDLMACSPLDSPADVHPPRAI